MKASTSAIVSDTMCVAGLSELGSIRKSNRTKNPTSAKQDDFLWLI